jgi:hypothetical protein
MEEPEKENKQDMETTIVLNIVEKFVEEIAERKM